MKTPFTYLILLALFIGGTRLVATQQKYTRSMPTPVEPKMLPFQQYIQLASHSVKETYHGFRPTTDAGVANVVSDEQTVGKSPNRKTTVALRTTVKNRKTALLK